MKKSLLEHTLSAENLNKGWRKIKRMHTPWTQIISRKELDWNFLYHVLHMRESVLSGNYRPEPQRRHTMKKADGKTRIISAQYLQDKLLQRCLLQILEPRAEQRFHEDSFGYRPNRGISHAIQRINERIRCGQDWLVDADIKHFFDSIPHSQLRKILQPFINDKATMKLIDIWLKQGTHQRSLLGIRRGISQGAVLSPLMCNLYLHQLDQQWQKANIPFVRFADDFLLFCTTKQEAQKALDFTKEQLDRLQLNLHPEKTRVTRSSPKIRFLGKPLPSIGR